MKHKTALISLVFIGCVFLFAGSAWAGRDHRQGHYYGKRPHYESYAPKRHGGHPHGWHHDKRFHHEPRHRGWHRRPAHRTVEKHVYHHYGRGKGDYCGGHYHAAGSMWDPGFSFSFGISGRR